MNQGTSGVSLELSPKPENQQSFFVQGQRKMAISAKGESARAGSHFFCLFVLFGSSADWMMSTQFGGHVLYGVHQLKC